MRGIPVTKLYLPVWRRYSLPKWIDTVDGQLHQWRYMKHRETLWKTRHAAVFLKWIARVSSLECSISWIDSGPLGTGTVELLDLLFVTQKDALNAVGLSKFETSLKNSDINVLQNHVRLLIGSVRCKKKTLTQHFFNLNIPSGFLLSKEKFETIQNWHVSQCKWCISTVQSYQ